MGYRFTDFIVKTCKNQLNNSRIANSKLLALLQSKDSTRFLLPLLFCRFRQGTDYKSAPAWRCSSTLTHRWVPAKAGQAVPTAQILLISVSFYSLFIRSNLVRYFSQSLNNLPMSHLMS